MKVGGGQNTDLEIWLGQTGHVRYMGDHSSDSYGTTVRRFNNIWPHINSDTINKPGIIPRILAGSFKARLY